jgi:hypothetical protein
VLEVLLENFASEDLSTIRRLYSEFIEAAETGGVGVSFMYLGFSSILNFKII